MNTGAVNESGFPSFVRRLFRRRDRLVFVTVRKPTELREVERKKAETTALLRRELRAMRGVNANRASGQERAGQP